MRFFLPRQIVFCNSDHSLSYYTLRFRWDGSFSLQSQADFTTSHSLVLLLDSSIPFRRHFQFSIQQRIKREFILASAAGLFPFALDEYLCCLGKKESESYIFALKNSDYSALSNITGKPAAILVSDCTEQAMLDAIQSWMNDRSVYALSSPFFPLDPGKFLAGILTVLIFLTIIGAWFSWMGYLQTDNNLVKQQTQEITTKAEPLLHKRMVIAHMHSLNSAIDKLTEGSAEQLLWRLTAMIEQLPNNCYIESIEFKSGRLEVHGWGTILPAWFIDHGITTENYQLDALPKSDRFHFWLLSDKT